MHKRELTRRRALLLGASGVGAVLLGACRPARDRAAAPTPADATATATGTGQTSSSLTADTFARAGSCALTPQQTGGPYYIDVDNVRGDIREDREGIRLRVASRVVDTDGCTPVRDAVVEIWHCDAMGNYSGFEQGGGPGRPSTSTRYLRGAQITNADGIAEVTTIYPGWYQGRAVHIHAKVHLNNRDLVTTQFYFEESLNETVFDLSPYSRRTGPRTLNEQDDIYRRETTLTTSKDGDGYLGLITIGIS